MLKWDGFRFAFFRVSSSEEQTVPQTIPTTAESGAPSASPEKKEKGWRPRRIQNCFERANGTDKVAAKMRKNSNRKTP